MKDSFKLVVDASAVLAVLLNEPEKPSLVSATAGATLLAPGCLHWEVGNAFSALLKRKALSLEEASNGLSIFSTIPIQEMEVSLAEAMELCHRHAIYAYDAYYLQLARKSGLELLTLDRRMIQVARKENIQLRVIE